MKEALHAHDTENDSTVLSAKCMEEILLAKQERNNALQMAKLYRNKAEQCNRDKRKLKIELERKN